jgi:imidazole glycerol-phosphate synthase subunit HisH
VRKIAIVDYGLGNLFNVERGLRAAGAEPWITSDPADLDRADGVVLPGVGAFGQGMQNLDHAGLTPVLQRLARAGKPTLGLCLGMQLLMDESEEFGRWPGLGLIPGRAVRFDFQDESRVKVPQIGWNTIHEATASGSPSWDGTLLHGLEEGSYLYFVHSYWVQTATAADCLAEAEYGGTTFCAVVARENVMGCQFHPEKSADAGLAILKSFLTVGFA